MKNAKQKILAHLQKSDEPVHMVQIVRLLGLGRQGKTEARKLMKSLVREGLVQKARGQTFQIAKEQPLLEGKFSLARDGYGFVSVGDGPDVFVPAKDVGGALDGDKVSVRLVREDRGRRIGVIAEVDERATQRVVGILIQERDSFYVDCVDRRLTGRIRIAKKALGEAKAGDEVGVLITHYADDTLEEFKGKVVTRFDPARKIHSEMEKVFFAHQLPDVFPEDVLREADSFSPRVEKEDRADRTDLTGLPFVTIDGEDARDFDDALCLEVLDGGVRRIYVAIADVSHYVQMGTALDREAGDRGTSVYFPTRVIPMLPENLSNGLCSLVPDEERLALALRMDLDKWGRPGKIEILSSVIRSHARLTYTQVQRLFDGAKGERPPKELHEMLFGLREIADHLFSERMKAGSIDLELPEATFDIDEEKGEIKNISSRSRTGATGLVEELMLLANRLIAAHFEEHDIPSVYRVHEDPDPAKVSTFLQVARTSLASGAVKKGMTLQKIQQKIADVEDSGKRRVLSIFMLRALQRARYQTENVGHFGLGFESYLHFTSPIRRYPDLVVHRLIRRHLLGEIRPPSRPSNLLEALNKIAGQSSELENRAVAAERNVTDMLKAHYMKRHLGATFSGVISGMHSAGFFITLGELPIDGFLPVTALPEDRYHFDPEFMLVTSEGSKKRWSLGTAMDVCVVRVDVETRQIELGLSDDPQRTDLSESQ